MGRGVTEDETELALVLAAPSLPPLVLPAHKMNRSTEPPSAQGTLRVALEFDPKLSLEGRGSARTLSLWLMSTPLGTILEFSAPHLRASTPPRALTSPLLQLGVCALDDASAEPLCGEPYPCIHQMLVRAIEDGPVHGAKFSSEVAKTIATSTWALVSGAVEATPLLGLQKDENYWSAVRLDTGLHYVYSNTQGVLDGALVGGHCYKHYACVDILLARASDRTPPAGTPFLASPGLAAQLRQEGRVTIPQPRSDRMLPAVELRVFQPPDAGGPTRLALVTLTANGEPRPSMPPLALVDIERCRCLLCPPYYTFDECPHRALIALAFELGTLFGIDRNP